MKKLRRKTIPGSWFQDFSVGTPAAYPVWWEARPKYNVVDPDWELFGQDRSGYETRSNFLTGKAADLMQFLRLTYFPRKGLKYLLNLK